MFFFYDGFDIAEVTENIVNLPQRDPFFEIKGYHTAAVDRGKFLVQTEGGFAFLRLVETIDAFLGTTAFVLAFM